MLDPSALRTRQPDTNELAPPRPGDPVYPPTEAMLEWLRSHDPSIEIRHYLQGDVECVSVRLHHRGHAWTVYGPAASRQKVLGKATDDLRGRLGLPSFYRPTPEDERARADAARRAGNYDVADAIDRRALPSQIIAARAAGNHPGADLLEQRLVSVNTGGFAPRVMPRRR